MLRLISEIDEDWRRLDARLEALSTEIESLSKNESFGKGPGPCLARVGILSPLFPFAFDARPQTVFRTTLRHIESVGGKSIDFIYRWGSEDSELVAKFAAVLVEP